MKVKKIANIFLILLILIISVGLSIAAVAILYDELVVGPAVNKTGVTAFVLEYSVTLVGIWIWLTLLFIFVNRKEAIEVIKDLVRKKL
jgi:hypothetical protein